jgi:lysophospholipase L1-like esterase
VKKRRGIVKVIAINVAVFLGLLLGLNLIVSIAIDAGSLWNRLVLPNDDRVDLPNYTDKAKARQILGEFHQLETRYEPFVEWRREEFHGETTTIDAAGNRTQPATTPDPAGTVRFFGGSAMWGSGVADDETIPAAFNDLHPDLRVVNHGESGFTSRQSVSQLVNLVNSGEPMDLVVFYDGNNDVGSFCQEEVGINSHTRAKKLQRLVRPFFQTVNDLTGSLQELLSGKAVNKWLRGPGPHPTRCHTDPAYARRVAEVMVNDWKIARAIAREGGADFVAILQPVASLGSPRRDHLNPDEYSAEKEQNVVYPIVRQILAEQGIDWAYDFTDVFDGDEYVYLDECHVSENGSRKVAERLESVVGPRLNQLVAARRSAGAATAAASGAAPARPSRSDANASGAAPG